VAKVLVGVTGGKYICREWNSRHTGAEQLRTFEIDYMWQPTWLDYRQGKPEKVVLWEHSCF
jgi:proteasome lid subunit RPN8/RPN11